jgi:hypothetical protein
VSIFQKIKKYGEPWYFEYRDHLGQRHRIKGFASKRRTQAKASKILHEVQLRKDGLLDPIDEKFANHRKRPLAKHLDDYESSLKARKTTAKHVRLTLSRVRKVIDGCGFKMIKDLDRIEAERFLGEAATDEGYGHRTHNHYVQAMVGFCNWMIEAGRMKGNPFEKLVRLNNDADIRHKRRSLKPNELALMIDAAASSNQNVQGYKGLHRARAYLFSYTTGLRQKEMAAITAHCCHLNSKAPHISLDARFTKNGKSVDIPMHPQLFVAVTTAECPAFSGICEEEGLADGQERPCPCRHSLRKRRRFRRFPRGWSSFVYHRAFGQRGQS